MSKYVTVIYQLLNVLAMVWCFPIFNTMSVPLYGVQAPKSTLKPIQILQNKGVKIIFKTYHCQSLLVYLYSLLSSKISNTNSPKFDDIVQLKLQSLQ